MPYLYGASVQGIQAFIFATNRLREIDVPEMMASIIAETTGKPTDLISALKKLSVDSLSNLTPHPLKVFLEYSHPPVLERIKALRKIES